MVGVGSVGTNIYPERAVANDSVASKPATEQLHFLKKSQAKFFQS
jgi:hypothetical protein